ncbi:MAG: CotH kinase family protein [Candidatus Peregrinibacteria bacterium]|nr:CotH kinase family protein [Candidatus Peregrinibacteria bacterium]
MIKQVFYGFLTLVVLTSLILVLYHSKWESSFKSESLFIQQQDKIPLFKIVIKKKNLEKLDKNLPPLDENYLSKEYREYERAKIIIDKQSYSIKLRYKGDFGNHWRGEKKSFKIKFRKDSSFPLFKNKEISFYIPEDKYHFFEKLHLDKAKLLGLLVPENKFVRVQINNDPPRLYWMVEDSNGTMYAKHKLTDDADFFVGDTNMYTPKRGISNALRIANLYTSPLYFEQKENNNYGEFADYSPLFHILNLVNMPEISSNDFYEKILLFFDKDSLLKTYLLYRHSFSHHLDNQHNWKLYYDKTSGKFIISPWDIMGNPKKSIAFTNKNYDGHLSMLFFYKLSQSTVFLKDLVATNQDYFLNNYDSDIKNLERIKNLYAKTYIKEVPQEDQDVFYELLSNTESSYLLMMDKNKELSVNDFRTNYHSLKYQEYDFIEGNGELLLIKSGEYSVPGHLVIPSNRTLVIEEGVILKFKNGRSLLVFGNIIAKGTDEKKIVLTSSEKNWGVLGIFSRNEKLNILENVEVLNAGDGRGHILEKKGPTLNLLRGPIIHFDGTLSTENLTVKEGQYTIVPPKYNNWGSLLNFRNKENLITGFVFYPDSITPIKIKNISDLGGIYLDVNKNNEIDINDVEFIPQELSENTFNKFYSRSVSQFSFGAESQAIPHGYVFLFKSPVIELVNVDGKSLKKTLFGNIYTEFSKDREKINYTREQLLTESPFLKPLGENTVSIAGTHEINETVIIPKTIKLIIEPGTKLIMDEDTSFVSYGKVVAEGLKRKPIMIKAKDPEKPFGVFALANKGASGSSFNYFQIEHGNEAMINGIYFSGMFSAYHNDDVVVENSKFSHSHSDDGLNFKYSNSKVINSEFYKNSADAIDFDFMSGEIRGNMFTENGNDSIDTSGSASLIMDNYIYKSGDKCMSFGENSRTIVINNILDSCFIGVECKDLTTSVLINNAIVNNKTAVNSYQKKDFFGPAHCEFYNTIFAENKKGITFENDFKDGVKFQTDTSEVTIKNSILPYDEFENGSNIIEQLSANDFSNNREANLEKLKEFFPEYLGNSVNLGILNTYNIPKIKK